ncbi:MAG TPA: preprotein translocase subunit SecE [Piscirickettsiaceae bacterium]|nr:preprotein translocase subunit SecE [Piscirickettsiaceae bacterium]HIQ40665.1 preprotein translocase subunit SecE [Sulfurivirga caldicuralii]
MSKHHRKVEASRAVTASGRSADRVQLLLGVAALVVGLVLYYTQTQLHQLVRVGIVLGAAGLAGYLVYRTEIGKRWAQFLSETRKELRLVVWPTRKEVLNTTVMIIVVVIIMGIFLWLVDMFFLWAVEWLTGRGG